MDLVYKVSDKPSFNKILLFAIQQLLAIIAGTIAVPMIVGNGMSPSAALFGAGIGTLVYLLITKFKSPIFLGSSFTFIGSMTAAFAGAMTNAIGYVGLLIGSALAGLVYVLLSIISHFVGTKWINKVFPPIVIGPTVALIGLTLSPNAVVNLLKGNVFQDGIMVANPYICLLCGVVTLVVAIICSVYGKKMVKLTPFIFGIFAGYIVALIFSLFGIIYDINDLKIIDFSPFQDIKWLPEFAFIKVFKGFQDFNDMSDFIKYFLTIFIGYVPVAFVCFAEHVADHKNLSFIIGEDLLSTPGLKCTLLGDGLGSAIGSFFGGCPNTTYGESISCVAFSRNASIITIVVTSIMAILVSFFGPLMSFAETIPPCVMGGLSIALYGFIASSGLQMLKGIDFTESKNIFVISSIFVVGIGGLTVRFYHFEFSPIANALVVGILINILVNIKTKKKEEEN